MLSKVRPFIYNLLIQFTSTLYKEVLERLPQGSRLLDIGIGTGMALVKNHKLIKEKQLHITGIDLDADYVRACKEHLASAGLERFVEVHHASITTFRSETMFDAVYFSNSFMLIKKEERLEVLRHAKALLKPGEEARIYFGQTHEKRSAPYLEWLKPRLKWLMSIDFGTVTYEAEFLKLLEEAGLSVAERHVVARGRKRDIALIAAEPKRGQ